MPQNHNRTMTLSKMAYSDNPEVASSYSFQIYAPSPALLATQTFMKTRNKERTMNFLDG
jgi:hypothetical protein